MSIFDRGTTHLHASQCATADQVKKSTNPKKWGRVEGLKRCLTSLHNSKVQLKFDFTKGLLILQELCTRGERRELKNRVFLTPSQEHLQQPIYTKLISSCRRKNLQLLLGAHISHTKNSMSLIFR